MSAETAADIREHGRQKRGEYLRASWAGLTGGCDPRAAEAVYRKLTRLYSAGRRAYHNLDHIYGLLNLADGSVQGVQHDNAVRFAIWFHDAIYRTRRKDNEERSADLAEQSLTTLDRPPDLVALVRAMILATKTHDPAGLPDEGKLFLDLDLSILGSKQTAYETYAQSIRDEYWWVPLFIYKQRRRQVLESFLQRERLFFNDEMFALFETQARQNLEREIAALS
jgi:predicted metal-dependent HD superfamily phosphohydrolase